MTHDPETARLPEDARRERNGKRWGPYLAERQWAMVREDMSPDGLSWESFPYEHSLGRAYRWNEDGLLKISGGECRLSFALALWNGDDPHLKERLFGLTNHDENHAEDLKDVYFYIDATPSHFYLKSLYKYPQSAYPYRDLRDRSGRIGKKRPKFELTDTGVFDEDRYWDVTAECAKASPDDIMIRITVTNRGPEAATLHLLPTPWCRNIGFWGQRDGTEGLWPKPRTSREGEGLIADHGTLGRFRLDVEESPEGWLFTENETDPSVRGGGLISAIGDRPGGRARRQGALQGCVPRGQTPWVTARGPASLSPFPKTRSNGSASGSIPAPSPPMASAPSTPRMSATSSGRISPSLPACPASPCCCIAWATPASAPASQGRPGGPGGVQQDRWPDR